MRIHQIGVSGTVLERLEGVAHATGHVDSFRGIKCASEDFAEGPRTLAKINPSAEDRTTCNTDELIPRLRMNATGHTTILIVANIVLNNIQIGNPKRSHLRALPVLLEPTARIAVDCQIENFKPLDSSLGNSQFLLKCDVRHLSVAPIKERCPCGPRIIPMPLDPQGHLWLQCFLCRSSYCPWARYRASVASLAGRHHASLATYQSMVSLRPSEKSV